jgi:hypothetical protein
MQGRGESQRKLVASWRLLYHEILLRLVRVLARYHGASHLLAVGAHNILKTKAKPVGQLSGAPVAETHAAVVASVGHLAPAYGEFLDDIQSLNGGFALSATVGLVEAAAINEYILRGNIPQAPVQQPDNERLPPARLFVGLRPGQHLHLLNGIGPKNVDSTCQEGHAGEGKHEASHHRHLFQEGSTHTLEIMP